jgi:Flp pilus assembly protein TadG
MLRSAIVKFIPDQIIRLARDQRGVSAVEFALILPLMLTLYLGGVEVSQGVSIDRKVTLTARTVADLTSQVASINNAGVASVLGASSAILSPFPATNAKITVSVLKIDANSKVTVTWSDTLNGTAIHSAGDTITTVPSALVVANTTLVWGEVTYTYKPVIGYVLTGTMDLKDQIFMRPRLSDTITRTAS